MSMNQSLEQPGLAAFPMMPTRSDRRRLILATEPRKASADLERILETAELRGFSKIAAVLRDQIVERDYALLERAASEVARDETLGLSLIQFATSKGNLHCRAWVDQVQEERLVELLGRVVPSTHVIVDVIR
ncbi:MAG: hypothetical protein NDJ92_08795 [Thermoanaerobaculia bacterium]|nr:hypothetical protein [Thermoanaerobaculia bacterium]